MRLEKSKHPSGYVPRAYCRAHSAQNAARTDHTTPTRAHAHTWACFCAYCVVWRAAQVRQLGGERDPVATHSARQRKKGGGGGGRGTNGGALLSVKVLFTLPPPSPLCSATLAIQILPKWPELRINLIVLTHSRFNRQPTRCSGRTTPAAARVRRAPIFMPPRPPALCFLRAFFCAGGCVARAR